MHLLSLATVVRGLCCQRDVSGKGQTATELLIQIESEIVIFERSLIFLAASDLLIMFLSALTVSERMPTTTRLASLLLRVNHLMACPWVMHPLPLWLQRPLCPIDRYLVQSSSSGELMAPLRSYLGVEGRICGQKRRLWVSGLTSGQSSANIRLSRALCCCSLNISKEGATTAPLCACPSVWGPSSPFISIIALPSTKCGAAPPPHVVATGETHVPSVCTCFSLALLAHAET